jgi:branched-chain amino acid transport system substrate-binding protein
MFLRVLSISAILCAGLCPTSSYSQTVKIGEVGSMTGSEATFGISTHQGIELAIKEQNAKGGVKGKKLELVSVDNQGKPEEAAIGTTKLITQDKVIAVLGEVASSRSLAMAPIAQKNKIPLHRPLPR